MNIRFYCTHFYQSSSVFLPVLGRECLNDFSSQPFLLDCLSWKQEKKIFICGNLIRRMKSKEVRQQKILKTALKVYMTKASTWINLINARHLNDCCFLLFSKSCCFCCCCCFHAEVCTHIKKVEMRKFGCRKLRINIFVRICCKLIEM